jgi:hypothetical protein
MECRVGSLLTGAAGCVNRSVVGGPIDGPADGLDDPGSWYGVPY